MSPLEPLAPGLVRERVRAAVDEDGAHTDATAAFLGLGDAPVRAEIRVAEDTVVSGLDVARAVFDAVDTRLRFGTDHGDGERVPGGAVLVRLEGSARSMVAAERTALNFLQRMCGVATHAARFVAAVAGTGVVILDTRKTLPLWRDFDKYAVRCGGARNHRRDLGDMILIKDNHVRALGGRDAVIARIAGAGAGGFVELEVDSPEFLDAVLASEALSRVDRIMLDNFTPAAVTDSISRIETCRRLNGRRIEVEVSGGITLANVRAYAQPGVDFISVGALTHSAPAAPMGLEVL